MVEPVIVRTSNLTSVFMGHLTNVTNYSDDSDVCQAKAIARGGGAVVASIAPKRAGREDEGDK